MNEIPEKPKFVRKLVFDPLRSENRKNQLKACKTMKKGRTNETLPIDLSSSFKSLKNRCYVEENPFLAKNKSKQSSLIRNRDLFDISAESVIDENVNVKRVRRTSPKLSSTSKSKLRIKCLKPKNTINSPVSTSTFSVTPCLETEKSSKFGSSPSFKVREKVKWQETRVQDLEKANEIGSISQSPSFVVPTPESRKRQIFKRRKSKGVVEKKPVTSRIGISSEFFNDNVDPANPTLLENGVEPINLPNSKTPEKIPGKTTESSKENSKITSSPIVTTEPSPHTRKISKRVLKFGFFHSPEKTNIIASEEMKNKEMTPEKRVASENILNQICEITNKTECGSPKISSSPIVITDTSPCVRKVSKRVVKLSSALFGSPEKNYLGSDFSKAGENSSPNGSHYNLRAKTTVNKNKTSSSPVFNNEVVCDEAVRSYGLDSKFENPKCCLKNAKLTSPIVSTHARPQDRKVPSRVLKLGTELFASPEKSCFNEGCKDGDTAGTPKRNSEILRSKIESENKKSKFRTSQIITTDATPLRKRRVLKLGTDLLASPEKSCIDGKSVETPEKVPEKGELCETPKRSTVLNSKKECNSWKSKITSSPIITTDATPLRKISNKILKLGSDSIITSEKSTLEYEGKKESENTPEKRYSDKNQPTKPNSDVRKRSKITSSPIVITDASPIVRKFSTKVIRLEADLFHSPKKNSSPKGWTTQNLDETIIESTLVDKNSKKILERHCYKKSKRKSCDKLPESPRVKKIKQSSNNSEVEILELLNAKRNIDENLSKSPINDSEELILPSLMKTSHTEKFSLSRKKMRKSILKTPTKQKSDDVGSPFVENQNQTMENCGKFETANNKKGSESPVVKTNQKIVPRNSRISIKLSAISEDLMDTTIDIQKSPILKTSSVRRNVQRIVRIPFNDECGIQDTFSSDEAKNLGSKENTGLRKSCNTVKRSCSNSKDDSKFVQNSAEIVTSENLSKNSLELCSREKPRTSNNESESKNSYSRINNTDLELEGAKSELNINISPNSKSSSQCLEKGDSSRTASFDYKNLDRRYSSTSDQILISNSPKSSNQDLGSSEVNVWRSPCSTISSSPLVNKLRNKKARILFSSKESEAPVQFSDKVLDSQNIFLKKNLIPILKGGVETQLIDEFNTETIHLAPSNTKSEGWSSEGRISEIISEERSRQSKCGGSSSGPLSKFEQPRRKKAFAKDSLVAQYSNAIKSLQSERRIRDYERKKASEPCQELKDFRVLDVYGAHPQKVIGLADEEEALLLISDGLIHSPDLIAPGYKIRIYPPWDFMESIGGRSVYFSIRTCDITCDTIVETTKSTTLEEVSIEPYKHDPGRIIKALMNEPEPIVSLSTS